MKSTKNNKGLPCDFCWSKMGAESGEGLEQIILRKELERLANGGVFAWGIGNSLGRSLDGFMSTVRTPTVVFTGMKSAAKQIDIQPESIVLWLGGVDRSGREVTLPKYSLITSRGAVSLGSRKKTHYALICESKKSLAIDSKLSLDGLSLVNRVSGKPVGASQVTSIVRQVETYGHSSRLYRVGFKARLVKPGQVILNNSLEIKQSDVSRLSDIAKTGKVSEWKREVLKLKGLAITKHRNPSTKLSQLQLEV